MIQHTGKKRSGPLLMLLALVPLLACFQMPVFFTSTPSVYSPASLAFTDSDIVEDRITGTLLITPAPQEDYITEYRVYRGTATTHEALPLATYAKTGSPITHLFANQDIAGYTHLVVCGKGPSGEYADCAALDAPDLVVKMLVDINPGINSSSPAKFVIYQDKLYFGANDAVKTNLYRLNDTADGVTAIPYLGSLVPMTTPPRVFNNRLYFRVIDPTFGEELGYYDGTTITSFDLNNLGDNKPDFLIISGSTLYFTATVGNNVRFSSDGLTWTTVNNPVDPDPMTPLIPGPSGGVFFNGTIDGGAFNLCRATGASSTTDEVSIPAGLGVSSSPDSIVAYNGKIYFQANDGVDVELFVYDPVTTLTTMVKNINPGGGSFPAGTFILNNRLVFSADDGTTGNEPWTSDGTSAGTVLLKDINPLGSSTPSDVSVIGNLVYFAATNGVNGRELWVSDGTTAGTRMIKDINAGVSDSNPKYFHLYNGKVYFQADDGGGDGVELFVTDGTAAGTLKIATINPNAAGSSFPAQFFVYNSRLYFQATNGTVVGYQGMELWVHYYK